MSESIVNTSRDECRPEWLGGANPRAIEQQEARGQKQFVESCLLPVRVLHGDRKDLESAGVVFGEPLPGDRLFCESQLPPGWAKRATDHAMWSELVDAAGVVRANIFYKAAFYDRDAFLNVSSGK